MVNKTLNPRLIRTLCIFIGLLVLAGAVFFIGQSIASNADEENLKSMNYAPDKIIDHTDIAVIKDYLENNPALVEEIKAQKWLFAHASVGFNIIDGLNSLHKYNQEVFPLRVVSAKAVSDSALENGTIYEIGRGNPGVARKFELFDTYLGEGGWNSDIDVAINKLCYIDIPKFDESLSAGDNKLNAEKLADSYIEHLSRLSEEYPDVTFVYTTMPLTMEYELFSIMRLFYNNRIREYCTENDKFLFDIADIFSHDADNSKNIKKSSIAPEYDVEYMFKDYTSDGGHLNGKGQKRGAKGWYALAASVLE